MSFAGENHDLHLSKGTINYSSHEKTLQVSVHVFLDDLESSLRTMGHDSLHLCTKLEVEDAETYIKEYLDDKLVLAIDGYKLDMEWVGKEVSEDFLAIWCYLEINDVGPTGTLRITNDILMDLYNDQKNIIRLEKDNKRREDLLFTKDEYTLETKL